jgi:hypothetical protein
MPVIAFVHCALAAAAARHTRSARRRLAHLTPRCASSASLVPGFRPVAAEVAAVRNVAGGHSSSSERRR